MAKRLSQGPAAPVYLVSADGTTGSEWEPYQLSDVALNDSDKHFVIPADYEYQVQSILVILRTSATVGNRRLTAMLLNASSSVLLMVPAGAVQAASTEYYYSFAPGLSDRTTAITGVYDSLATPFAQGMILPTGYQIQVMDQEAIDAAADDMLVWVMVLRRPV